MHHPLFQGNKINGQKTIQRTIVNVLMRGTAFHSTNKYWPSIVLFPCLFISSRPHIDPCDSRNKSMILRDEESLI